MPPSVAAARTTEAYRARLTVVRDTAATAVGDGLARLDLDRSPASLDRALRDWLDGAVELVAGSRLRAGEASRAYLSAYLAAVALPAPARLPAPPPVDLPGSLASGRKALLFMLGRGDGREAAQRYARYVAERNARTLIGDAARDVLTAGIQRTPQVTGFRRVTSEATCSRCAALTDRTYAAREAFERTHEACRCTAEPVLRGLPEVVTRQPADVVAV